MGHITSVAVTAVGTRIVSGSSDRTVKVWDRQTGQETHTLKGHTHWVSTVAISGDGKRIVYLGQFVPLSAGEATRLAALAGELLAQKKDASALHYLGAAQYRAGQFEQAAGTLEESIKLHGRGGYVNTRLFLAMTRQRLGQHAEARRLFDSWSTWLKAQDFKTWQEEVQWGRLHKEAKQLILTMPRAEN